MTTRRSFPYHRGVAPMMWVLFALSIIELFATHFFVTMKWPHVGWPLTILSGAGVVWIFVWIRSFRRLPHVLDDGSLLLRLGNLRRVSIDITNIERIRRGWEAGAAEQRGAINLAGIAYPNRCIELNEPVRKGAQRVFVLVDNPDEFDVAMSGAGVVIV